MSDIYDILGKLNGLQPKDNPISMSAEPIYESIDPTDITSDVSALEEKYQKFLAEAKSEDEAQPKKDVKLPRNEPEIVKFLNKAKLERPTATSDVEALAYQMVKQDKELEKAVAANDAQEQKIADLSAKITSLSTAKPATAIPATQPIQQVAPTTSAPAPVTPAPAVTKPSAAVLKFPTPVAQPKSAEIPATAQPTPTATKTYKPAVTKPTVGGKVKPADTTAPGIPVPDEFTAARLRKQAKQLAPNVSTIAPVGVAVGQQFAPQKQENKLMKDMLKESIELLREYKEGDPQLGIYNFNDMLAKFNSGAYRVTLDFGGKPLTLYDYQAYGLLAYLGSEQNQERKVANIENVLSSHDAVVNALMSPKVKKYILMFPEYEKMSAVHKQRAKEIEKGKFQLSAPDPKKGFTDPNYNPKTDPTSPEYDPTYPVQSHPYQQSDSQLEENLGTTSMKNLEKLEESLMEKYMGWKKTVAAIKKGGSAEDPEAVAAAIGRKKYGKAKFQKAAAAGKKLGEESKPDFLDLDKDGDTEEPMKQAAKQAKEHEPAAIDKSAVEKRKRLQALKDKQEDERAEKDDYDSKSSVRTIKGRAYGGAAQKDAEEKDDLDEVAPPGAKAERMVKHIKKGYAKDGKLTKREKGIAYATAWKAHNKGQVEEGRPSAADKVTKDLTNIATKKGYKSAKEFTKADWNKVAKPHGFTGKEVAAVRGHKVAEATEFGDTIKNSEAKMTKAKVKMTEGKEAIRNHPIYTNEEAWNHYAQELAEQEAMEAGCMEAPVVDVQEELNEIARLAGLAPKMEAKCSSCGCTDCKCDESIMDESTRKHFVETAKTIRELVKAGLIEKAKDRAQAAVEIYSRENPRFDKDRFYKACDLDIEECGMGTPATIVVGEEETMDEGNEFTKARLDAIAQGKDTFTVGGKTYNVSGDTSDEKSQVEESTETVTEDININVSATGEEDVVNLIRKLSGMPVVAVQASPVAEEQATCEACGMIPCGCDQVDEERDIELANTPHETVAPITAVTTDAGGGIGGVKKQYPATANRGANPIEETLWKAYEEMINDVKV